MLTSFTRLKHNQVLLAEYVQNCQIYRLERVYGNYNRLTYVDFFHKTETQPSTSC